MAAQRYEVVHRGQAYCLTLRASDDGYVTGYDYAAVQLLVGGILGTRPGAPDELFADEARVNAIMNIITVEGQRRSVETPAGAVPLPWASWLELDYEIVRRVIHDFFSGLTWKTQSSPDTASSTQTADLLSFVSAWLTLAIPPASKQQETPL